MENETKTKILKPSDFTPEPTSFLWQIPECCREGWESCKHVVQKQKKVKNNIGL
jgi:hypothetical protein